MTELAVTPRNFANAPKNVWLMEDRLVPGHFWCYGRGFALLTDVVVTKLNSITMAWGVLQHHVHAKFCESPASGQGNDTRVNSVTFWPLFERSLFRCPAKFGSGRQIFLPPPQSRNCMKFLTMHTNLCTVCTVHFVEFSYV